MKNTETTEPTTEEDRFEDLTPSELNDMEKQSLMALALATLAQQHQPGEILGSPEDTRRYLQIRLADRKNEVFGCLLLDNRHRIIAMAELFQGTIDGSSVHPRVIVQKALELNAAAMLFFHNHPSGVAEPSQADEAITRRLKEALALIDVRVLDHFVVTAGESVSFAERGLI
ncbi:MAG: DNA repair protein RadC [gamma proteobacterium symbiont of Ctena orbiculata]|nr:MAG: DNA repair protein RadC [gamma proteobacterium symbiont of Ctena orbiculata]